MDEILCHVRTVLADPGKGNGFLLITDFIDILKSCLLYTSDAADEL